MGKRIKQYVYVCLGALWLGLLCSACVLREDEQAFIPLTALGASDTAPVNRAPEVGPSPTPTVTPTPSPTPSPTPTPTPTPAVYTVRMAFTGDLMVHERQLQSAYNSAANTYNFASSFENIKPYLMDADYTVGNLETTLAGEAARYGTYPLFNSPDAFGEAVRDAGFDFVSTANNHSNDKREAGILRTLEVLDALGLEHAGTYASQAAQEQVFIKEINQIRFAFISCTYGTNGIPLPDGKPYLINLLDENLLRQQITQARLLGADMVVVLPHMGNEYEETPRNQFKTFLRSLCQYGADVIMASHPHVLQPTEVLEVVDENGVSRTCFIAYSMGNFISSQRTIPRDVGGVFYLSFEKITDMHGTQVSITEASFVPTWVKYINTQGQYDIRVLPLYDTLKAVEAGEPFDLRPADLNRIKDAHRDTTQKMLGAAVPLSEILPEYILYARP